MPMRQRFIRVKSLLQSNNEQFRNRIGIGLAPLDKSASERWIVDWMQTLIRGECTCARRELLQEKWGGMKMAKYGKTAQKKVEKAMHERKAGTLKSGRSGKKVTSKKQAIAIGLSEARKRGAKVPKKASSKKR